MKIERKVPNVVTYVVTPEKDDFARVAMPVYFMFDSDQGLLSITGDCGNYHYKWGHNDNEEFLHLMSRLDEEYFLGKISDQLFDVGASIIAFTEYLDKYSGIEWGPFNDEVDKVKDLIKALPNGLSEYEYLMRAKNIVENNFGIKIDTMDISVEKKYPLMAEIAAELFMKYVKPTIKKDMK